MPRKGLSDEERRDIVLRSLRRENRQTLADEYGITRDGVQKLLKKTLDHADEELAFWREVVRARDSRDSTS